MPPRLYTDCNLALGIYKIINTIYIEKQGFQPQTAPKAGEQPCCGHTPLPPGSQRQGTLSLTHTSPCPFRPSPLTWSAESGKARQKEADPGYSLPQGAKQSWRFSAIQAKTDGNSRSALSQASTWEKFLIEAPNKARRKRWWPEGWENEGKSQTLHPERMTIIQKSTKKQFPRS